MGTSCSLNQVFWVNIRYIEDVRKGKESSLDFSIVISREPLRFINQVFFTDTRMEKNRIYNQKNPCCLC